MKLPVPPPSFETLFVKLSQEADKTKFIRFFDPNLGPADAQGRYLHCDKLRHLQPPTDWTPEDYWLALKIARKKLYKSLPFVSIRHTLSVLHD